MLNNDKYLKGDNRQFGVCDVHRLVNKDSSIREVRYCSLCSAWMCQECWNNLPKRALAATIQATKIR